MHSKLACSQPAAAVARAHRTSCRARNWYPLYGRLFELLKNAMRAVVEAHRGRRMDAPPPVVVRICDAPSSVTLRISDQARPAAQCDPEYKSNDNPQLTPKTAQLHPCCTCLTRRAWQLRATRVRPTQPLFWSAPLFGHNNTHLAACALNKALHSCILSSKEAVCCRAQQADPMFIARRHLTA